MYHHQGRLPTNEDRIIKQRQYEESLCARRESLHEYGRLMCQAKFEQSNELKTNQRSLEEKLQEIHTQRERFLCERRRELKDLLDEEEFMLEQESKTVKMDLAERRAWLEDQARKMKSERLANNKEFVEKQIARIFRENSDDVRIHNSKLAVMKSEETRKKQRDENMRKKMEEKAESQALHKMMEREWKSQDEIHCQDVERQNAVKEEAVEILREQLNRARILREEEREAVEEDMRNMVQKWAQEEESLKKKQYEKRLENIEKTKELLAYNEQCRSEKLAELQAQKSFDARMIAMLDEREKEDEKQEKHLKDEQKREARAYAAQLKAAVKRKEAEDAELEAIIRVEFDEEFEKKSAEARHREEIKRRMTNELHNVLQAQIELKENMQRDEKREKEKEYEKCLAEMKDLDFEAKQKADNDRSAKREMHDALQAQMRSKKASELVAKERKRAEFQDMKAAETRYEEKVKQELSLPYPEPWYGRKAVKWYE